MLTQQQSKIKDYLFSEAEKKSTFIHKGQSFL